MDVILVDQIPVWTCYVLYTFNFSKMLIRSLNISNTDKVYNVTELDFSSEDICKTFNSAEQWINNRLEINPTYFKGFKSNLAENKK